MVTGVQNKNIDWSLRERRFRYILHCASMKILGLCVNACWCPHPLQQRVEPNIRHLIRAKAWKSRVLRFTYNLHLLNSQLSVLTMKQVQCKLTLSNATSKTGSLCLENWKVKNVLVLLCYHCCMFNLNSVTALLRVSLKYHNRTLALVNFSSMQMVVCNIKNMSVWPYLLL